MRKIGIVTGTYLSPEFGLTHCQTETDGFQIDAKVEMLLSSDSLVGIAKSIGLGVIGFVANALNRHRPAACPASCAPGATCRYN